MPETLEEILSRLRASFESYPKTTPPITLGVPRDQLVQVLETPMSDQQQVIDALHQQVTHLSAQLSTLAHQIPSMSAKSGPAPAASAAMAAPPTLNAN